jgi:thiol:disulfide interchange protein DsbD
MRKQEASRGTVAAVVALLGVALPAGALAADAGPEGTTLVAALLGGLLASLTPCVYPVIPLAVGVIGSWGEVGRRRAAFLSAMYAAGMTTTYAALGVVAGLTGVFFGGWSASPALQFFFALLMWIFAAAMLGVYVFRLPAGLVDWASSVGGPGPLGSLLAGAVSGIMAAGCTGPALGGILVLIGATQDAGSAALLMVFFSVGLSLPFFLLGAVLPRLPRPGRWLVWVETALGLILIGAGSYFAVEGLELLGVRAGASLAVGGGLLALLALAGWARLARSDAFGTARIATASLVAVMAVGATSAGLGIASQRQPSGVAVEWVEVRSSDEFRQALAARPFDRPVIVDFHADWCTDCKAVQRSVFRDPGVIRLVNERFTPLRVDATAGAHTVSETAARYQVPGVPAVRFLDRHGGELADLRIDGPFDKSLFRKRLELAGGLDVSAGSAP